MTAPTRRRTRPEGKPPPAALLLCEHDGGCGEPFARQYFSGLRCSYHAPSENDIKAVAAARYRASGRQVRIR